MAGGANDFALDATDLETWQTPYLEFIDQVRLLQRPCVTVNPEVSTQSRTRRGLARKCLCMHAQSTCLPFGSVLSALLYKVRSRVQSDGGPVNIFPLLLIALSSFAAGQQSLQLSPDCHPHLPAGVWTNRFIQPDLILPAIHDQFVCLSTIARAVQRANRAAEWHQLSHRRLV